MLTTVRQKPWQKTQLWGLYKTQDGSLSKPAPVPKGLTILFITDGAVFNSCEISRIRRKNPGMT